MDDDDEEPGGRRGVVLIVVGVVLLALVAAAAWWWSSRSVKPTPRVQPKQVGVVKAQATTFRPLRVYVGSVRPWNQAAVSPQYVAAYVSTVLVRPGATVKRGQVLATLDCRNASAASRETAARAKALAERQTAAEHQADRVSQMQAGGFASTNELEQEQARAASQRADVESLKAQLTTRTLEVDDCILRAPFDGDVAERVVDPGAFVRPGEPVVTVIDRSTVRVVADAPEADFAVVSPGTPATISLPAVDDQLTATVTRRAPAADETTRTVHFELDVPNQNRAIPVATTARVAIEVGEAQPALAVPARGAALRGDRATLFVVDKGIAHKVVLPVLGERDGQLYLAPRLPGGTEVVVEGRALLDEGDAVGVAP